MSCTVARFVVSCVAPCLLAAQDSNFSIRFFGADDGLTDRVLVHIDDDEPGADHSTPADLGIGDFSVEFWVRGTHAGNPAPSFVGDAEFADERWLDGAVLVDRDIAGPSHREWGIALAGGFVCFGTGSGDVGSNLAHTLEGDVDVLDDAWHHVACVRDAASGTKSIYVDGALDMRSSAGVSTANLSYPNVGVPTATSPWGPWIVFGARKHPGASSTGSSFVGWMDEVRLWRRALSESEIALSYDDVLDGDELNLVGYYRFEEGAGASAPDWSLAGSAAAQIVAGASGPTEWASALVDPNFAAPVRRDALPPGFENRLLTADLVEPTVLASAPDGRLFIGERAGRIRAWRDGAFLPQPLLVVAASADVGERGVSGLVLDPQFAMNGWIYVHYTTSAPRNRVSRFTVTGDVADPQSELVVWENTDLAAVIHHGGGLAFGADGKLYIATGDQGFSANAHDLTNQHGKLLRVESDGSLPSDNPYLGAPGVDPYIASIGLRNPFRIAADSLTGRLYLGDVGGNAAASWEEIDVAVSGADYGWPMQEGPDCNVADCSSMQTPLWSYRHDDPLLIRGDVQACVVAGAVYRGSVFPVAHQGALFIADYANRWIRRLTFDANGDVQSNSPFLSPPDAGSIVDLEVGADGALYYVTIGLHNSGAADVSGLHRIRYIGVDNVPPTVVAAASPTQGATPLAVQFTGGGSSDPDQGPGVLTYEWDFDDGQSSTEADPLHVYANEGAYHAVLKLRDGATSVVSASIEIVVGSPPIPTILQPQPGLRYRAGDTIVFDGAADDGEGAALPSSAMSWRVLLIHESHAHPFLGPIAGNGGSFQIPWSGHTPANTHYELQLDAIDASGLSATTSVALLPETTLIRLRSHPSGVTLYVDGEPLVTPYDLESLVGFQHWIEAPATVGPRPFRNWSDGGAIAHTYSAPPRLGRLLVRYSH